MAAGATATLFDSARVPLLARAEMNWNGCAADRREWLDIGRSAAHGGSGPGLLVGTQPQAATVLEPTWDAWWGVGTNRGAPWTENRARCARVGSVSDGDSAHTPSPDQMDG